MFSDSKFITSMPREFKKLKNPPTQLYFRGDESLLYAPFKVAILGSRKPNQYARALTTQLSSALAKRGAVIVSGGALGVDILAHAGAMPRTIMVSPSGLDVLYPTENAALIAKIQQSALAISEYAPGFRPFRHSFLERNRMVVALGRCVIIPHADLASGSMNSANLAVELGIPVFVLPHRIGESQGTNLLLAAGKAGAIYDVNTFVNTLCADLPLDVKTSTDDEFLKFCAANPSVESTMEKFGEKVTEYELEGKIAQKNGRIVVL